MSTRLTSFILVPVVLASGALALAGVGRDTTAVANVPPPLAAAAEMPPASPTTALPPNHPAIGTAGAPHGSVVAPVPEPPGLTWTAPAGWQETPSPNAMRLATYRAPGGLEVSVARAGGATEANIQRWVGQFDDVGNEARTESTVRGLHVVSVEIAGTYVGGGAAMGGPADSKTGWAMLGTIVETKGSPYFFKMVGPADAVRAAQPAFTALVASVTPS